ncbi:hypothetical protein PFISCL1PPCAC_21046 [Pristionchus fissidentatus]|uniref:BTB domain-containing protein n=1 Tax=Pristionchus fissidentatus TaxID=1538716 RepID=A0AAV5WCM1_9BILA|nr:hypothetical protein PFISCL1PPCAC_21046 [Pristionchus fissidentatus]
MPPKRRRGHESPAKDVERKKNSHRAKEDNIIRFRFDNISQLTDDRVESPPKNIGGFNWYLFAEVEESDEDSYKREVLNVGLCVDELDDFDWFCVLTTNAKLISPKDDADSAHKRSTARLGSDHLSSCVALNMDWKYVLKSDKVKHMDFFSPSNISDVILIVEGEKLHVNKQILAHHSSFFETLFFGSFKESNQSEIKLEDVTVEDMVALLNVVYSSDHLRLDTVESVLKLADRFDMKLVLSTVDNYLIGEDRMDTLKQVFMADKYKLPFTLDASLKRFTSRGMIRLLKEMEEFESLSDAIKEELLHLAITLPS